MNEANQLVPSRTVLLQMVQKLRWGAAMTVLTMMQPQGLMVASHPVVLLGMLHMHCLQM